MTAAAVVTPPPPPPITNRRTVQNQQQRKQQQTNELTTETFIASSGGEFHVRILPSEELESRVPSGSGSGQLDQRPGTAAPATDQLSISSHSQRPFSTNHSSKTSLLRPTDTNTSTSITLMNNSSTFIMFEQLQSQCFHSLQRVKLSSSNSKSTADNMTLVAVSASVSQSLPTPTTTTATRKPFITKTSTTTAITPLPTTGICLSHLLLVLILASSLCLLGGGKRSIAVHCAPIMSAANIARQQPDQLQQQDAALLLVELANRPSNQLEIENPLPTNDTPDDVETILLVLADRPASLQMADPAQKQLNRRLRKRSGISDQRLVELQMRKALKNMERAKNLAASNLSSSSQEATSS